MGTVSKNFCILHWAECGSLKMEKTGSEFDLKEFHRLRNKIVNQVRRSNKYYYSSWFHSIIGDSRHIYDTINTINNNFKIGLELFSLNDGKTLVSDTSSIAKFFNDFSDNVEVKLSESQRIIHFIFDVPVKNEKSIFLNETNEMKNKMIISELPNKRPA